jgi:putative Mg2+ transporter-C (MgtC) family protein
MEPGQFEAELLMVARVGVAMMLGGIIGFEREIAGQAAGLRTHMLIAGAAALIVGLGHILAADFSDEQFRALVRVDPVRLVEAVVAAVGFVGAGSIIRRAETDAVHGLTTAASMLMVAGLGVAAGLDHFTLAIGATLLCVMVLWLLGLWEKRVLEPGNKVPRKGARR